MLWHMRTTEICKLKFQWLLSDLLLKLGFMKLFIGSVLVKFDVICQNRNLFGHCNEYDNNLTRGKNRMVAAKGREIFFNRSQQSVK
jgi:hypothetical protein